MNQLKLITIVVTSAILATACGKKDDHAAASQVAAKVNSGEITVHQINFALQRIPGLKQDQLNEAKTQVLDNLITQELAVQQAVEKKLDRDPNVQQLIESARRDILAKAYLDQATKSANKPSQEEIKKYYADHPDLFSSRKIYRIEEVGFNGTPEALALVNDLISKNKTGAEIVTSLKAKGIDAGGGISVKPAEQIPLELLPKIAQSKEGQPQLITVGNRSAVFTVLATKSEPINETSAAPVIEQFIQNKTRADAVTNAIKQLRDSAKIEYVGDFANTKQSTKQPDQPTAQAPSDNNKSLSKGIAGLK